MQTDPVQDIIKRTQRYWYEDGIWDISFGGVNALLGAFYLIIGRLDWNGPLSFLLAPVQMIALVGLFLSINKIVRFLKERITYPRTGYVAYRKQPTSSRVKRALFTMLLAAGMAALVGSLAIMRLTANHIPLTTGVILAGTMIYIGYRFNLVRLYVVAVLTVLWGLAVSLFQLGDLYSTGAFFTGFGTLILLSGLVTLILYMRRTQPATDNMLETDLIDPPQDKR